MGLAKVVNVLGKFVASKGGKLGTVLERNSGKLEKIEIFSKDYLKKNKKQLAAAFLTGLAVGGCTFKGCSSSEEPVKLSQTAKNQPKEYNAIGLYDTDTIVFKSKSDAENFTKLLGQYKKEAVDRTALYYEPYYDALGSKADKEHEAINEQIEAEYNKQKKAAEEEFEAKMAPIDSVKNAKKKKNNAKFAATPEGKAINAYWQVYDKEHEHLRGQFKTLLDVFNGKRKE